MHDSDGRPERLLVRLARLGTGLAFSILIVSVLIQVLGRLYGSSPVWTEELTRYSLLYMVAFGAGLAFRNGDLVNVDVISESLPGRLPRYLRFTAALLTVAVCGYLLPKAWKFVSIGKMQTAPALGIRMDFVHLSVFIMLAGLALFALLRLLDMLLGRSNGLPVKDADWDADWDAD